MTQLGPFARLSEIDPVERFAGVVSHKDCLRIHRVAACERVRLINWGKEIEQDYSVLNPMCSRDRARLGSQSYKFAPAGLCNRRLANIGNLRGEESSDQHVASGEWK